MNALAGLLLILSLALNVWLAECAIKAERNAEMRCFTHGVPK